MSRSQNSSQHLADKATMVQCFPHLDSAARDEYILLVDVKVDMRDGGEVGCAPFVKVSDELEGEVGQLVTVCGQDERAGGRQPQRGPVEGPKNSTA